MSLKPKRTRGKPRDLLYAKALAFEFDPWLEMLKMAQESVDPQERFYRLEAIMPYIKPKLRSMDVKIDPGSEAKALGVDLIELFKEVLQAKVNK